MWIDCDFVLDLDSIPTIKLIASDENLVYRGIKEYMCTNGVECRITTSNWTCRRTVFISNESRFGGFLNRLFAESSD